MTGSYEDYQGEYNANLSRIRSYLAGTRNRSTLTECERLLQEAKSCATAMQGLAEVDGDNMRISEARNLLQRDIAPLQKEVSRAVNEAGREELFYQAPDLEQQHGSDMSSLIRNSEDLLRESQSVMLETEHIGNLTLQQMGRQREQLQSTNQNLERVQAAAEQARNILTSLSRRACRSRLALYGMIFFLCSANVFVIYRIYKKNHPSDSSDGDGGGW